MYSSTECSRPRPRPRLFVLELSWRSRTVLEDPIPATVIVFTDRNRRRKLKNDGTETQLKSAVLVFDTSSNGRKFTTKIGTKAQKIFHLPLDPTVGLPSPKPHGPAPTTRTPHCKILGTPMYFMTGDSYRSKARAHSAAQPQRLCRQAVSHRLQWSIAKILQSDRPAGTSL